MRNALNQAFALSLLLCTACAMSQSASDDLRSAVMTFNESIRWKRFETASRFLPPEERKKFLETSLAIEDDVFIDSVEVRALTFDEQDDTQIANVTVAMRLYVLPSTIIEKKILTQQWHREGRAWKLKSGYPEFKAPAPKSGSSDNPPQGSVDEPPLLRKHPFDDPIPSTVD